MSNASQNADMRYLGGEGDESLENSNISSGTEFKLPTDGKLAVEEDDGVLSQIESAENAVYDPASGVPTSASLESGIVGMRTPLCLSPHRLLPDRSWPPPLKGSRT